MYAVCKVKCTAADVILYCLTLANVHVQPCLLLGEPGSAKTVMVEAFMKRSSPDECVSRRMNFSSATLPVNFQASPPSLYPSGEPPSLYPSTSRRVLRHSTRQLPGEPSATLPVNFQVSPPPLYPSTSR